MSNPVFWEKQEKNIILSSAENAQRVVKVNIDKSHYISFFIMDHENCTNHTERNSFCVNFKSQWTELCDLKGFLFIYSNFMT